MAMMKLAVISEKRVVYPTERQSTSRRKWTRMGVKSHDEYGVAQVSVIFILEVFVPHVHFG